MASYNWLTIQYNSNIVNYYYNCLFFTYFKNSSLQYTIRIFIINVEKSYIDYYFFRNCEIKENMILSKI